MSQNSLTVATANGHDVRTNFNNAIQSLASMYSGAADPATHSPSDAFPYMWWADTQNNLIKQRNANNDAWITKGVLLADGTIQWYASIVKNTPAGNISATDVQEAINELDTEKVQIPAGMAQGDILYRGASGFERLAAGTSGQTLQTNGPAANPSWGSSSNQQVGVVDNIVNGMEVTAGTGLQVIVAIGRAIIDETVVNYDAVSTIALSPRMASLIYAKLDKTVGKVDAKYPIDMIDNNTVGFWVLNKTGDISNLAVGKSSIAVANDLVPNGGLQVVDGYCDYAVKGDGSTGCYASKNSIGFPVGASEKEISYMVTINNINTTRDIGGFGSSSPFTLRIINARVFTRYQSGGDDTGFDVEVNKTYIFAYGNDGSNMYLKINGLLVFSKAVVSSTDLTTLKILCTFDLTMKSADIIHFIELRNKMRTPAQIAQISNKLLLPCSYQTPQSPVPLMTANISQGCIASASSIYSSTYQEYKAFRKGSVPGNEGWQSSGSANTGWLQITLPSAFAPKYVDITSIVSSATYSPKDFTIYGSNDGGTTKITLLTVTGVIWTVGERKRFYIFNTNPYTTLGINITANSGASYIAINDLDFGTDAITTTDIRSVSPADAIILGLVKTGSMSVNEIDCNSYGLGIRKGATGGNRKVSPKNIPWKYFSGVFGATMKFDLPFASPFILHGIIATDDVNNPSRWQYVNMAEYGGGSSGWYSVGVSKQDANSLTIMLNGSGITYQGQLKTSGIYLNLVAEVIE